MMRPALAIAIGATLSAFPAVLQAEAIAVPGVLAPDTQGPCILLTTESGYSYVLANYAGFVVGDSVVAIADSVSVTHCYNTYLFLPDNSVASYRDFDFGCGTLYVDPEYGCAFFDSGQFGPMRIASYGQFVSGDTIHVVGDFRMFCGAIPECFADPCLDRNVATTCLTSTRPCTWGSMKALFR